MNTVTSQPYGLSRHILISITGFEEQSEVEISPVLTHPCTLKISRISSHTFIAFSRSGLQSINIRQGYLLCFIRSHLIIIEQCSVKRILLLHPRNTLSTCQAQGITI